MARPYRIVPRREIPADAWNSCADGFAEAWLWHRGEIVDALSYWEGYGDESFGVCDETGRLVAIAPLHRVVYRKWGGLARLVRLESQGGFALDRSLAERPYRSLRDFIREHLDAIMADAVSADIKLTAMAPAWRGAAAPRVNPLLSAGFDNVPAQSWVIDLAASPEEIRERYSHGARYELKRAGRLDGTMREATPADLETFHRLHLETYSRTGARPIPLDTYRIIFERMLPPGFARILLFERGGRAIAAHTTGLYKNAACYWNGVSSNARDGGENRALFDAQIMAARAAGCELFDAGDAFPGSADAKSRGLSDFKGSFGGELAPVWRGRRHNPRLGSRLLRAAREARSILARPA